jgi:glutaredoxin
MNTNKYFLSFFKSKYTCHNDYLEIINESIKNNEVVVFGLSWCPWTLKSKEAIEKVFNIKPVMIYPDLVNNDFKLEMVKCLKYKTGSKSVPHIWIKGESIGDYGGLLEKIVRL